MSSFDFEGLFLSNYMYCYCQGDLDLAVKTSATMYLLCNPRRQESGLLKVEMIAVSASCGFKGLSLDPRVGERVHPMYFSPGPVQSCS